MSDKVCPQDEVKSAESAEKRLCPDSDPLDKVCDGMSFCTSKTSLYFKIQTQ